MHFFDASHGGQPLLWQHLFWIFGHPWVYIVVLPAMSMASDMIPAFSRRPLVGYAYVAFSTVAVGIIGFGVWVHHMFADGQSMVSLTFFSGASMIIAIPSAVSVFAWIATIWQGRPVFRTAFLFLVGFIVLFVIGGVSGVVTASAPFDWQATDSYFVVAHLHYVLVGINLFPVVGGRLLLVPEDDGPADVGAAGPVELLDDVPRVERGFFPMHILGLLGMPRRIYTYAAGSGWTAWNMVVSIGSFVFAFGFLLFLVNVWWSRRHGAPAPANPWRAGTLEWSVASPPPPYNFARIPRVGSRHPLWESEIGERATVLGEGPPLDDGHEAVSTTAREARPTAVLRMPGDSLWPFYLSVAALFLFYALLFDRWVLAGAAAASMAACLIGWLWPGADFARFPAPGGAEDGGGAERRRRDRRPVRRQISLPSRSGVAA